MPFEVVTHILEQSQDAGKHAIALATKRNLMFQEVLFPLLIVDLNEEMRQLQHDPKSVVLVHPEGVFMDA